MAMVRASWKKSLKDLSCGRVMAPLAVEGKGFLMNYRPESLQPGESYSHWISGVVLIAAVALGIVAGVWLISNVR